jgi:hypothetical protein
MWYLPIIVIFGKRSRSPAMWAGPFPGADTKKTQETKKETNGNS